MDEKDRDFLDHLKATFVVEVSEHVRAISGGILELEENLPSERKAEVIESIFREAHSLKGAARSVGFKDIEAVCQSLESAFAALKDRTIDPSPFFLDLILKTTDTVERLVSSIDAEDHGTDRAIVKELIRKLADASTAAAPTEGLDRPAQPERKPIMDRQPIHASIGENPSVKAQATGGSHQAGTVRIPAARLDSLLFQAEELVQAKIAANQRLMEARDIERTLASLRAESRRPNQTQGPKAFSLDRIESGTTALANALERDLRSIRRMVDEHLEAMKKAAMLPVASLMEGFPKMVRDLAREQGKDVGLIVQGGDIEIDKRVLEEIKDPLIHLVRNCVDHGFRDPAERAEGGKERRGTIRIIFSTLDSRRAEIIVSDDGEGVNIERVREMALRSGLVARETAEKMNAEEVLSLIFLSGISTSPLITDLSGRGLGLAIVREKIDKLGGTVSVESHTHAGTTFRLIIPLTLATFRGVLVRAGDQAFAIPTINVERAVRVARGAVETIENRETIRVEGQALPLIGLCDTLGQSCRRGKTAQDKAASSVADRMYVVVLSFAGKRVAFVVDEIIDEAPIMMKNLGRQLKRVRNIAGATVLGSGDLALVLNVPDLMKSAVRTAVPVLPAADTSDIHSRKGRILVAEDSITARTLLKGILEAAGYQVTTAVDGVDAYAKMHEREFDLVVSDVDMPGMSGFELCSSIRGDERFARVPVLLVTALESREDRERGIDAGANAYIVKSSFEQSNLLEIIRRLI
jgi:two-component system chemotaxis sensor kinase CheA